MCHYAGIGVLFPTSVSWLEINSSQYWQNRFFPTISMNLGLVPFRNYEQNERNESTFFAY